MNLTNYITAAITAFSGPNFACVVRRSIVRDIWSLSSQSEYVFNTFPCFTIYD